MAATHVKAYAKIKGARIVAVCNPSGRHLDGDLSRVSGNVGDPNPVRLDMAVIRGYRDYNEFLQHPNLELVDITSPTMTHPELAIAALSAGKHVVVEKPLARTSAAAQKIVRAAQNASTFVMPAMCLRFWPEWAYLKKLVAEETYGRTLAVRFRRVAEPPAWGAKHFPQGAMSGGALLDLHIHDVDFVQHLFGMPEKVVSTGYTKFSGAIDHVVTQYTVKGGAIVHAEGSWAMTKGFGFNMSYTANFERATLDYDLSRGTDALKLSVEGKKPKTLHLRGHDGYVGELQHMLDAIRSGKAPSTVTIEEGLSAVRVCEAEERSISAGKAVQL